MELLISAVKNAWRKRLRSMLTVGGIAVGVMSVVIITIVGDVGKKMVNVELDSMGINGVCLRLPTDINTVFDKHSLELVQQDEQVDEATPLLSKVYNIMVHGVRGQAIAWGVDGNADKIISMDLKYGRLINKSDVAQRQNVCVVDETFAQKNYSRENIVGKTVKLYLQNQYIDFTVVGVVSSGGNLMQSIMGEVVPTFLYIPYSTMTQYTATNGFTQIVAKVGEETDENTVAAALAQRLDQSFGISGGVRYENLNGQKENLNSVLNIVAAVLSVIGGISLLVAGLSIMTVMLVTVSERTREIGIKKSIGASKGIILLEFLFEALSMSLFGGIIGALSGLAIGAAGCALIGTTVVFNLSSVATAIGFAVATGTLFGIYPAVKAAELRPVDALRQE